MLKDRNLQIAYNHLQKSIDESEKNIKDILESINQILNKDIKDKIIKEQLSKIVEKLEFQDICAQRLKKVQNFLEALDKKNIDSLNMDDFEWKREIDQNDVDEILKSHGIEG